MKEEEERRRKAEKILELEHQQNEHELLQKKEQERIQQQVLEAKKNEELKQLTLLEQKKKTEQATPTTGETLITAELSEFISASAKQELTVRMNKLQQLQKNIESVASDPQWPNLKREYFRRINLAIQQISADREQVFKKCKDLIRVLEETKHNKALYSYCQDLICKKIMEQGIVQVTAHKDSCYPISLVVVIICSKAPELLDILLAHFHTVCPYTVPQYIPKLQGQTNEEWLLALGYKTFNEPGTIPKDSDFEAEDSYFERMSGILSIYAAITQTDYPASHPFGIKHAWIWLARILNMKPKRITSTILYNFLEVMFTFLYILF